MRWFEIRHIPIEMKWQTTCHTILPQLKLTVDGKRKTEIYCHTLHIYNNIIANNIAHWQHSKLTMSNWLLWFMQTIRYRFGFKFSNLQLPMNNEANHRVFSVFIIQAKMDNDVRLLILTCVSCVSMVMASYNEFNILTMNFQFVTSGAWCMVH